MAIVQLDGKKIITREAFHDECQSAFGFPGFYGRNMDAWIDALSYLRDAAGNGMTRFRLNPDEVLEIRLLHSGVLRKKAPDILGMLEECVEEVNERYLEAGEKPALALILP